MRYQPSSTTTPPSTCTSALGRLRVWWSSVVACVGREAEGGLGARGARARQLWGLLVLPRWHWQQSILRVVVSYMY